MPESYFENLPLIKQTVTQSPNTTTWVSDYLLNEHSPYKVTKTVGKNGYTSTKEEGKNNNVEVQIVNETYPDQKSYSDTLFISNTYPKGVRPGQPGYKTLKRKFERNSEQNTSLDPKDVLVFPNTLLKFITKK